MYYPLDVLHRKAFGELSRTYCMWLSTTCVMGQLSADSDQKKVPYVKISLFSLARGARAFGHFHIIRVSLQCLNKITFNVRSIDGDVPSPIQGKCQRCCQISLIWEGASLRACPFSLDEIPRRLCGSTVKNINLYKYRPNTKHPLYSVSHLLIWPALQSFKSPCSVYLGQCIQLVCCQVPKYLQYQ